MLRTPPRRLVLIFAKAPEPGRVKTRLAAEIGNVEAARIYREMGLSVVNRVAKGPYRTIVCFDPPDARNAMIEWLGIQELDLRPQSSGNLGTRLRLAFRDGFREADQVCAVGTDVPLLDSGRVELAFAALAGPDQPDVVLGPAFDGGYYLIALRQPQPDLFRQIPWSTDRVLETSLRRAKERHLRVELLSALPDVDRPADIPEHLRQWTPT